MENHTLKPNYSEATEILCNYTCYTLLLIARHHYVTRVIPPRVSFYKKWQTKNISVAFGSFFTYQVKEATESLLLLLGDYLLQPSKAKRAVDWNHAGASGSINQYTGSSISALLKA